jgi:Predicted membrane protein
MIIWMLWLLVFIGGVYLLIYRSHRKMYDLKMKYHWVREENTHIVHIDTEVSSWISKYPLSHWWNLPPIVCVGILLNLSQVREYYGTDMVRLLFPGIVLITTFLFWGLQLWFLKRKNMVYSTDSAVNMAINSLEKRTWSVLLLSANYLNLLSFGYLVFMLIIKHWLYTLDYTIYIMLQMLPAFLIVAGVIFLQTKRKEYLRKDHSTILTDDDEYWKNGWYHNPDDNHLWVQDRMCSTNYSLNMAKPAAKIMAAATGVFTILIVGIVFSLILSLENAKISFQRDETSISINAAMYHTDFQVGEIQSVKILNKLPEDDFIRTNGGETEKYLIGHFRGKETGKCMMFLYRGYEPLLEIRLKDEIIYVNSKRQNEVQEWYQELNKGRDQINLE